MTHRKREMAPYVSSSVIRVYREKKPQDLKFQWLFFFLHRNHHDVYG